MDEVAPSFGPAPKSLCCQTTNRLRTLGSKPIFDEVTRTCGSGSKACVTLPGNMATKDTLGALPLSYWDQSPRQRFELCDLPLNRRSNPDLRIRQHLFKSQGTEVRRQSYRRMSGCASGFQGPVLYETGPSISFRSLVNVSCRSSSVSNHPTRGSSG